jgi:hypothetical protein
VSDVLLILAACITGLNLILSHILIKVITRYEDNITSLYVQKLCLGLKEAKTEKQKGRE